MDEIYLLWLLSISMLICSFISGLVPMAFKMSENRSRLLALLGSGILVGTALAIIIPEGIDSLYGQRDNQHQVIGDGNHIQDDQIGHGHRETDGDLSAKHISDANSPFQTPDANMTWTVGTSLIVGFLLMLLIDQFSIYQSGGHQHHYHDLNPPAAYEISKVSRQGNYTLASQDDDMDIGMEEEEEEDRDNAITMDDSLNEMKPIKNSGSHNVTISASNVNQSTGLKSSISSGTQGNNSSYEANPNSYYDHSRHISATSRVLNTKVTPTLGLVIHAAADGIALGAAATTSHRDVEMIIFLAIMLHKAPAAFSLVVLLLHNGLKPPTIRRHLLAFSLSAPIAAIVTYYGLSQQGKEALRRNNATGVAMLFSAGTFLFVATVHVLPELIQNRLLTPKEMIFLLGGAFLPLILAQTV